MKLVTYADKSLLIDDGAADTLLAYAAAVARGHTSDTVALHAVALDGHAIEATVLLGEGVQLLAETASSVKDSVDNSEAVAYMKEKMEALRADHQNLALDPDASPEDFALEED